MTAVSNGFEARPVCEPCSQAPTPTHSTLSVKAGWQKVAHSHMWWQHGLPRVTGVCAQQGTEIKRCSSPAKPQLQQAVGMQLWNRVNLHTGDTQTATMRQAPHPHAAKTAPQTLHPQEAKTAPQLPHTGACRERRLSLAWHLGYRQETKPSIWFNQGALGDSRVGRNTLLPGQVALRKVSPISR